MISTIDLHVADKTMQLKSKNYCISFVSLIWCGEVIMCCYNNISDSIMSVFSSQELSEDDTESLQSLIKKKFAIDN